MDEKCTKNTQENEYVWKCVSFFEFIGQNDKSDQATEIKIQVRNKSFAIIGNIPWKQADNCIVRTMIIVNDNH